MFSNSYRFQMAYDVFLVHPSFCDLYFKSNGLDAAAETSSSGNA